MKKSLGNILFSFLEEDVQPIADENSNNEVAKERFGEKNISVNKTDIEAIMQQLVTIATEGLTIQFDTENISNLESVANTISGLAEDLQDKILKLKG